MRILNSIFAGVFLLGPALWASAAEDILPPPVLKVLAHRSLPADSLSIVVEELDTGYAILEWHESTPRNPASVAKMVTTLAALDILGPAYRWDTNIFFIGDVADGSLDGDILLQGTGDPFLVTEQFWRMLKSVRRSGIETINGDLLLDDSYFDVAFYDPAAFDREPLRAYNVGPNALLSNLKVVRYYFEPAVGGGVNIRLDPELEGLKVYNQIRQVRGSCRGFQRGIAINMNETYDEVTFSGRFPSGCDVYAMDRTALGHNEFTHSMFKSLWQEVGGEFSGSWLNVQTPEELLPDMVHQSLPLSEIITKVNKHSNNVMARQLLYTLGAEVAGRPATEDAGRDVILDWLADRGVLTQEVRLDNGAGLSRDARMTTRMLVDLLRFGYESPFMPEYVSSLSLSGLDGTLSRRFKNGSLTGAAHMKTGSLDHVTAIAGYFQARSGKRYLVAVIQNYTDVHRGTGEEVQHALLTWLNDL